MLPKEELKSAARALHEAYNTLYSRTEETDLNLRHELALEIEAKHFWFKSFLEEIQNLSFKKNEIHPENNKNLNFKARVNEKSRKKAEKNIAPERKNFLFIKTVFKNLIGWQSYSDLDTIWHQTSQQELDILSRAEKSQKIKADLKTINEIIEKNSNDSDSEENSLNSRDQIKLETQKQTLLKTLSDIELKENEKIILQNYLENKTYEEKKLSAAANTLIDKIFPQFLSYGNSDPNHPRNLHSPDDVRKNLINKAPTTESELKKFLEFYAVILLRNKLASVQRRYDHAKAAAATRHIKNDVMEFAKKSEVFHLIPSAVFEIPNETITIDGCTYKEGDIIYLTTDERQKEYEEKIQNIIKKQKKPDNLHSGINEKYQLSAKVKKNTIIVLSDKNLDKCPSVDFGEGKSPDSLARKYLTKPDETLESISDPSRARILFPGQNRLIDCKNEEERKEKLSHVLGVLYEFWGSNVIETRDTFDPKSADAKKNKYSTGAMPQVKIILELRYAFKQSIMNQICDELEKTFNEDKELKTLFGHEAYLNITAPIYRKLLEKSILLEKEIQFNKESHRDKKNPELENKLNRSKQAIHLIDQIAKIMEGTETINPKLKRTNGKEKKIHIVKPHLQAGKNRATKFEIQFRDFVPKEKEDKDHKKYEENKDIEIGKSLGIVPIDPNARDKDGNLLYRSINLSEFIIDLLLLYEGVNFLKIYPYKQPVTKDGNPVEWKKKTDRNTKDNLAVYILKILTDPRNTEISKKLLEDESAKLKIESFLTNVKKHILSEKEITDRKEDLKKNINEKKSLRNQLAKINLLEDISKFLKQNHIQDPIAEVSNKFNKSIESLVKIEKNQKYTPNDKSSEITEEEFKNTVNKIIKETQNGESKKHALHERQKTLKALIEDSTDNIRKNRWPILISKNLKKRLKEFNKI